MTSTNKVHYGAHRLQTAVLRVPSVVSGDPTAAPVVVLVHGGFWRWPYNRWLMRLIERDLTRRGWATCSIGYRRLGRFGGGGGWPMTFDDVRNGIDAVSVHEATTTVDRPVVVVGHSAGGQLALVGAATATHSPALVVAMSAPTDLERLWKNGSEPIDELTSGAPETSRWTLTSPMHLLPIGVPVICTHGGADTTVSADASTRFVAAARASGDDAEVIVVPGATHRDALRPASSLWKRTVESIAEHLQIDTQV